METLKSKDHAYEILFYISITLYLVGRFAEYTTWVDTNQSFFSLIKNVAYLPLIICLLFSLISMTFTANNTLKVKSIFIILLVFFMLFYAIYFDVNAGFVCFSYAICLNKLNHRNIYRYLTGLFIFLLLLGILTSLQNMTIFARDFGNTSARYSFAFKHPYTMQLVWMSIVSMRIICKEKANLSYTFGMSIITVVLHILGGTRSAFFTTLFLLLFDFLVQKGTLTINSGVKSKKRMRLLKHVFLFCTIVINGSCILMSKYPNLNLSGFDYLVSGRISMTVRYFNGICQGRIPLWPTTKSTVDLSTLALNSLAIDSEYSQFLFGYGLIFTVVVILLMDYFIACAIEMENWSLVIILLAIALNSLMEPSILSILYNPCFLLIVSVIKQKDMLVLQNKGEKRKKRLLNITI